MKFITLSALAGVAFAFTSTMALAASQEVLIHPITKELTFVFVPKVIHPWYDVVAQGGK